ncbi:DUF3995 domain-containing protein [Chitinophaga oryzae]|uniref:DUF3995 domain-containing protein n=1 Tax=Chitinophaga oryzae TaxID=2725414 RepID=A0AAE6ZJF5_9BACT|nr:DUF3995 domain-containing protein [Chitinophaga oryzae]QJB33027.1 DUF3995 domain-containing protein [Chitinophaga oryzae]QJB39501.1 DUF3995 domain-containing protein [Chitinophaga oryzae]
MLLPAVVAATILVVLSAIHFYWAFGGRRGMGEALPVNAAGELMLTPGAGGTFIVALGLLFFALAAIGNTGAFDAWVSRRLIMWTTRGVAAVFALRAIGDFKYVGLFRKVKTTPFGRRDMRYFTPLCIVLCVLCLLAAWQ